MLIHGILHQINITLSEIIQCIAEQKTDLFTLSDNNFILSILCQIHADSLKSLKYFHT